MVDHDVKSGARLVWSDWGDYRRSFGCFGSGVAVVTAMTREGRSIGVTINSYTSVSLEPPLVLWCLRSNSLLKEAFSRSEYYAINILSEDQVDISRQFCSKVADRFEGVEYTSGVNGTPLLLGCAAVIECEVKAIYTIGDHEVLVGKVMRHAYTDKSPLAFLGGNYGEFNCQKKAG